MGSFEDMKICSLKFTRGYKCIHLNTIVMSLYSKCWSILREAQKIMSNPITDECTWTFTHHSLYSNIFWFILFQTVAAQFKNPYRNRGMISLEVSPMTLDTVWVCRMHTFQCWDLCSDVGISFVSDIHASSSISTLHGYMSPLEEATLFLYCSLCWRVSKDLMTIKIIHYTQIFGLMTL